MRSALFRISALIFSFIFVVAPASTIQPAFADEYTTGEVSVTTQDDDGGSDGYRYGDKVYVSEIDSGNASFDASTNTLTISNLTCNRITVDNGGITIEVVGTNTVRDDVYTDALSPIALSGSGTLNGNVYYDANVTINGPKINGSVYCSEVSYQQEPNAVDTTVVLKSGTVAGTMGSNTGNVGLAHNVVIEGGIASGGVQASGDVAVSGGTIAGAVRCEGSFTMKAGKITSHVSCDKNFTMSGGNISFANSNNYIRVGRQKDSNPETYNMTVTGGTIDIKSPSDYGIKLESANLLLKGGTVNVANSYGTPISAYGYQFRGKVYGGKVVATGGSIAATCDKSVSDPFAIKADSMTNTLASLMSIRGRLPIGASFAISGNEYIVSSFGYNYAKLTKYGSKKTKAAFGSIVKFGGVSYNLNGIGANAFNTSTGKKLKSIAFNGNGNLRDIGANAFANTKALTSLKIRWLPIAKTYTKSGKVKSAKFIKGESSISKKAFSKCGKKNGKRLTFRTIGYVSKYKTLFKKYGLPSGVTCKSCKG